jgi:hypothetical protein
MVFNCEDPHIKKVNRVTLEFKASKPEYELLVRGRKMKMATEGGKLRLALEPGEAVWILDL